MKNIQINKKAYHAHGRMNTIKMSILPKDTLSEIKNNLQKNNSGVDEAKNQINDLEHKEEKSFKQNNKKKESKKARIV